MIPKLLGQNSDCVRCGSGATRLCCNNIDIMTHIRNTGINIIIGNGNIIKTTKMGNNGMIRFCSID